MFTPRTRSGLQVTLAAALLVLSIGLAGAAAVTLSVWFAAGSGASVMLAAVAWFWTGRDETQDAEEPAPVMEGSPGYSSEAYGFTEWAAAPRADTVSASYPQNLARDMMEAPRVYAEEEAAASSRRRGGSASSSGQPAPPPAPRPRRPAPNQGVRHWEPGTAPAPASFHDASTGEELVEFMVVNPATTPPMVVSTPTREVSAPVPVERPSSEFVPDLNASRYAAFYEPKKPRYEKTGLSDELKRRRERMARELPLVGGMLSDEPRPEPAESHPGKTRGKCSKCNTYLWAPAKRPLRVRCPKCGHEARLT